MIDLLELQDVRLAALLEEITAFQVELSQIAERSKSTAAEASQIHRDTKILIAQSRLLIRTLKKENKL